MLKHSFLFKPCLGSAKKLLGLFLMLSSSLTYASLPQTIDPQAPRTSGAQARTTPKIQHKITVKCFNAIYILSADESTKEVFFYNSWTDFNKIDLSNSEFANFFFEQRIQNNYVANCSYDNLYFIFVGVQLVPPDKLIPFYIDVNLYGDGKIKFSPSSKMTLRSLIEQHLN